jgi:predicted dinucleotide-binding enzyme
MNIFGDPSNVYTLTLVGDGEVGVKLANGWVSQKIKVEYGFNPAIQREVLIE